jgi:arsenical pump membrane protein
MQIALIFWAILITVVLAIHPFRKGRIRVSFGSASLVFLALFLLFGVINSETITTGLLSNGSFEPWKIILIFFTVAYVSVSVDATGIFDYFAYKLAHAVKGSGFRLFLGFYLLGALLTLLTSNDIVILTLTPVIFYLSQHAKINVIPFLFAEFFVANTASMLLFVGDPTNIILGSSLGVGFLEFSTHTWVPGLVALACNFVLLWIVFRKQINTTFKIKPHDNVHVNSWVHAIGSFSLLIIMLLGLVLSDWLGVEIWLVTTFFAFVFVFLNTHPSSSKKALLSFKRIPWQILPFIIAMFVFVQRLTELGFVDRIAQWIVSLINPFYMLGASGLIAFVMSNLMNNQPTAIFFANVLNTDAIQVLPFTEEFVYPVVIATSLGANITLVGALAGLLWRDILSEKGLRIGYTDFLKKGIIITPITFAVTLFVFLIVR